MVLGGAAAVVAGVVAVPATGGAIDDRGSVQVSGSYRPVAGDFDGDGFGDIFWYRPGSGPDPIWFGSSNGWTGRTSTTEQVYGDYQVVAGDFGGDGIDDLLLHRPSQTTDVLWTFDGNGDHAAATVPGRLGEEPSRPEVPLVGHFDGDERDDVLWYGPGNDADSIWLARGTSFQSTALSINGTYRPAVGDFDGNGSDDVLWGHNAGAQPLWLATGASGPTCSDCFTRTSRTFSGAGSVAVPADVDGDGRTDIVWYGAGSGADALWRATGSGAFFESPLSISGTYQPIVREAFNQDQIVWYSPGGTESQWFYDGGRFVSEAFPQVGAGLVPLVGVHRGPFPDEDIFFYGAGSTPDVQTYVSDSSLQRVRS